MMKVNEGILANDEVGVDGDVYNMKLATVTM